MSLLRLPRNRKSPHLSPEDIAKYLDKNPKVVEEFLLTSTTTEFLENVIEEKKTKLQIEVADVSEIEVNRQSLATPSTAAERPQSRLRSRNVIHMHTEIGIESMCRKITSMTKNEDIYNKIYEVSALVATTLNADDFMFFVCKNENDLALYNPEDGMACLGPNAPPDSIPMISKLSKKPLRVNNVHLDEQYPDGTGNDKYRECHALCVPIILESGSTFCAVEFVRLNLLKPFDQFDHELTTSIFSWIMACVQKMKMNRLLRIQEGLNKFLLESTKVMFDEMEDIDTLITNIMALTKDLVHADRCSLFLVDDDRNELYADYFDDGQKNEQGVSVFTKKSQIRFSKDRGIAGYVARTGEIVNIRDAYSDERFNTEVDKKTGYRTRNILCMPITGKTGVTGVVQLINSLKGSNFTHEDESAFQLFAMYCALALHYSHLYNMIAHSQFKSKVAMEVMHYHISCSDEEFNALYRNPILPDDKVPPGFYDYNFCCYGYDNILPQLFIKMVTSTFGQHEFPLSKLCRFVLTVRKNYRPIQYHNWQHGFHVAHQVWRLMELGGVKCTRLEKMALLIGGVCHDVDHRGYNNEFFKKLQHPLAALYSTSVMEQHHYKQTITILHAEGHDIFSILTVEQHKEVVELIRKYIIATDLATFFPNQKFLTGILDNNEFDVKNPTHRDGLFSLMMTSADLCAICKPWETQKKTAQLIYEEFYMQGDEEKKHGLQPIPMMDRINKDDIPKMQVGFITFVCKPMYTTLQRILPKTKPLLDGCIVCLENWKAVHEEQLAKAAKAAAEGDA